VYYSDHYVEVTAQQEDSGFCDLNGVCFSENYMVSTAQQVDSGIVG